MIDGGIVVEEMDRDGTKKKDESQLSNLMCLVFLFQASRKGEEFVAIELYNGCNRFGVDNVELV